MNSHKGVKSLYKLFILYNTNTYNKLIYLEKSFDANKRVVYQACIAEAHSYGEQNGIF